MKKEDIPQDDGALNKLTKEVVYVVDNSGNYTTELSTGWDIKPKPLMWHGMILNKGLNARQKVLNNEASLIFYFLSMRLMDIGVASPTPGF